VDSCVYDTGAVWNITFPCHADDQYWRRIAVLYMIIGTSLNVVVVGELWVVDDGVGSNVYINTRCRHHRPVVSANGYTSHM
jgi:hypothetical protein